jgi:hypothetical protein
MAHSAPPQSDVVKIAKGRMAYRESRAGAKKSDINVYYGCYTNIAIISYAPLSLAPGRCAPFLETGFGYSGYPNLCLGFRVGLCGTRNGVSGRSIRVTRIFGYGV